MIDLMNQMGAVDHEANQVKRGKHMFDDEEDLDLDNLDL